MVSNEKGVLLPFIWKAITRGFLSATEQSTNVEMVSLLAAPGLCQQAIQPWEILQ